MNYNVYVITIEDLISLYENEKLKLDPPYQRNFIWSKKDQEKLIDSVIKNYPLPNIFLLKKDGIFEVVDGQQRIRTIMNYHKGLLIPKLEEQRKQNLQYQDFLNYKIIIAEISNLEDKEEHIEEFYARVNKTGLKLNKPELDKAEYFYTEFLALNQELAGSEQFNELDIFTEASSRRMNDIDFISELVTLLHFGLFEKKEKVNELYEQDITLELKESLKSQFLKILDYFLLFNSEFPIKNTRFRQRNDFFTLFGFIKNNINELSKDNFVYIYKILILIQDEISPSNDFCYTLREYALNCVTQSNSKRARQNRLFFLEQLFLNKNNVPNKEQSEVMKFYEIETYHLKHIGNKFYALPIEQIEELK